jgi:hypothetical protein
VQKLHWPLISNNPAVSIARLRQSNLAGVSGMGFANPPVVERNSFRCTSRAPADMLSGRRFSGFARSNERKVENTIAVT